MIRQIGRFDGKNYYLTENFKERKVSKREYEMKTTNSSTKRLLLELITRVEKLEELLKLKL